jgi:hypothetical protein
MGFYSFFFIFQNKKEMVNCKLDEITFHNGKIVKLNSYIFPNLFLFILVFNINKNHVSLIGNSKETEEAHFIFLNWLGSGVLSLLVCLSMCLYEIISFYSDSLLKREGGSLLFRKFFLWFISSSSSNSSYYLISSGRLRNRIRL